jgi:hypothetical protein
VRLQSLVEIVRANTCDDNRHKQKQNRKHGETGQTLSGGLVVFKTRCIGRIHAHELEKEVPERDKVHDDDDNHASNGFSADPEGGEEQKDERDDKGCSRETQFDVGCVFDDDKELDGKSEEEEEVEL